MFLEGITKENELNFVLDFLYKNDISVREILKDLDNNGNAFMYFVVLEDYYSVDINLLNILDDKLEKELGIYCHHVELISEDDKDMYFLLDIENVTMNYKEKIKNVS